MVMMIVNDDDHDDAGNDHDDDAGNDHDDDDEDHDACFRIVVSLSVVVSGCPC